MTRLLNRGLKPLFLIACALPFAALAACAERPKPIIEYRDAPPVLPDPALVVKCDTSEGDPVLNIDLADELSKTRKQLGICAGQVDGVRDWRATQANKKPPG